VTEEPYAYVIRYSFLVEAVLWSLWTAGNVSTRLASLASLVGVSSTFPYQVVLKGEPLYWKWKGSETKEIGGFFATRYVMALSPEQAGERAVRIVRREVSLFDMNPPESPV